MTTIDALMEELAPLMERLANHDANAQLTEDERDLCLDALCAAFGMPDGSREATLCRYLDDLLDASDLRAAPIRAPYPPEQPACTLHAFAAEDIRRVGATVMQRPIVHAIVTPEDDWFVAQALEVDIASQGKTRDEALANLREAIELAVAE